MGNAKERIESGKAVLGIEFGSTRIKAVLVDETHQPIASGAHDWENQLVDGIWTYSLDMIWDGLRDCYRKMTQDVQNKYGVAVTKLGAIGFSGMMHGYMPFDGKGELLVPFRTWRNTITGEAAAALTKEFSFNIPQRWSIAHLYQAILNGEEHVDKIAYFTTLAGYIHWKLTGEKVLGVGEASGMFPIDAKTRDYNRKMLAQFDALPAVGKYTWKLEEILPKVLVAGENAGTLTEEGAKLLDPSGRLEAGIPLCPPEGDAGTGNEFGGCAHRKCICRNICVCNGGFGGRLKGGTRGTGYGDHTVRRYRGDGALQQLYLGSERLGRFVPGVCGELRNQCRYERAFRKALQ